MKKLFLETSLSKIYILIIGLICLILLGSYFSYAMFTVSKEKSNAISIVTGNLTYDLKVDGIATNELTVESKDTKIFTITLTNPNNRTARFNFYYENELPANVYTGYLVENEMNTPPEASGVNLTDTDKSGSSNIYKIIVSNESSEEVTITLGVEVGLDYNDLSLPSDGNLFEEATVSVLSELVKSKANAENLDFLTADASEQKEAFIHTHPETDQTTALMDYRYIGTDPNNYVSFNKELWRIIGVFTIDDGTGNLEERVKLIRTEGFDSYSWDNKDTTTGAEVDSGKNYWPTSRLNYLLNPGHENELNGGSYYWNGGAGLCYSGVNNATISCDFSTSSLNSKAKSMIDNAVWYLGGPATPFNSRPDVLTNDWYSCERSNNVYQRTSGENATSWTGYVGLIYPSDYGYATSGNGTTSRSTCLNTALGEWNNYSDCYLNNWLYDNYRYFWTITASSVSPNAVFRVSSNGEVNNYVGAYDYLRIYPVVYLKADIKTAFGTGEVDDPYVIFAE